MLNNVIDAFTALLAAWQPQWGNAPTAVDFQVAHALQKSGKVGVELLAGAMHLRAGGCNHRAQFVDAGTQYKRIISGNALAYCGTAKNWLTHKVNSVLASGYIVTCSGSVPGTMQVRLTPKGVDYVTAKGVDRKVASGYLYVDPDQVAAAREAKRAARAAAKAAKAAAVTTSDLPEPAHEGGNGMATELPIA